MESDYSPVMAFGAEVTGVCSSRNVDMVRLLGADHVIDYTRDDFTQSRERYDLVLDNVANRSLSDCRRALASDAILISNGRTSGGRWIGPAGRVLEVNVWSPFVREKLRTFLTKWNNEDLIVLNELIESGKITPVIDTTLPLSEAAEAIRYLEAGHAGGENRDHGMSCSALGDPCPFGRQSRRAVRPLKLDERRSPVLP